MKTYIVEAMLYGEWVEVFRGTHAGYAQHEYDEICRHRGSRNVRMRVEE